MPGYRSPSRPDSSSRRRGTGTSSRSWPGSAEGQRSRAHAGSWPTPGAVPSLTTPRPTPLSTSSSLPFRCTRTSCARSADAHASVRRGGAGPAHRLLQRGESHARPGHGTAARAGDPLGAGGRTLGAGAEAPGGELGARPHGGNPRARPRRSPPRRCSRSRRTRCLGHRPSIPIFPSLPSPSGSPSPAVSFSGSCRPCPPPTSISRAHWPGLGSMRPHARRLRRILVMADVGLALVLLCAASLLLRSFVNTLGVDPGFRAEGVVTAQAVVPTPLGTDLDQAHERWRSYVSARSRHSAPVPGASRWSDQHASPLRRPH